MQYSLGVLLMYCLHQRHTMTSHLDWDFIKHFLEIWSTINVDILEYKLIITKNVAGISI